MDMISELPDELLLKILSSLFLKDVIATSILSRRWRSLWKLVTKVKIGNAERSKRCLEWISRSLAFSNPHLLKSLDLKLVPGEDREEIKSFVEPAVYRGLRELRIELLYTFLELPLSLYACPSLETLTLCRIHLVDIQPWVRSSALLSVKFSSDESVGKLLRLCPVLENLIVRRSGYSNVNIFTINVPTLRSLSIDYLRLWRPASQPAGCHGFVIDAPSLRYLNIRDHYSNHLLFTNMPELVKANVDAVCDQSESLIGSLASTRHLSLCSKISNIPYHAHTFFFFLEHLELCTCSAEWWNLLTRILKDAPRLRLLKLKSIHCVEYNDPIDRWNQPNSVPGCLSSHLEILEWRQYKGTKPDKQVAKYILANARHLKMATFSSNSTEKHQMFNKLEHVPICSEVCQLLFN